VAVAVGEGPWEAFGIGLGRLGYRLLVVGEADPGPALDAEGLVEDLTLVGHGRGGRLATAYAAARPERMKRLVLIAPEGIAAPPRPPPPEPESRGLVGSVMARLPWFRWRLAAAVALVAPPPPPQEAEHRRLGRDDVPVVAIWAGSDEVVPLRALGDLAAWNRMAKHEVIEGAGHDLMATHGERLVETLRGILREDERRLD